MKTNILLVGLCLLFSNYLFSNTCATAEVITAIPYSFTGTTVGAGNNYSQVQMCNSIYGTGNDFVFEYTSTGDEVLGIELENLNDDRHGVFVFDGCPDDPTTQCLVQEVSVNTDSAFIETAYLVDPGTYYIVVSSWIALTTEYDFEIFITAPIGNICENAETIPSIPFNYTGTTVGAGNDYSQAQICNSIYGTGNDFVFEYISAGDEVLGIELENLNDDRHGVFVFDGCPDDPATQCLVEDFSVNTDSAFIETAYLANPGTYYIVVSSWISETINYDFEISFTSPIGNICENAEVIPSIPYTFTGTTVGAGNDYNQVQMCNSIYGTGNDFVFEYSSAGDEVIGIELENLNDDRHGVFVFDGCPDDPATQCLVEDFSVNTDSAFIETAYLADPGTYYIVVSSWVAVTVNYDFEININPRIGNICENARQITSFPYSYTGTTREAGNDYSQGELCNSVFGSGRDYVFEYTPLGDEYLSMTLTNLNDDLHGLFIIEGCPNDTTSICYDFDTESTAPISINTSGCLTAGTTYYIVVSSFGAVTEWYNFTLDVDQNLQVSVLSAESSGLTNDNYLCADEAGTAIVNLTASASGGNGGVYSYMWDNAASSTTASISEMPNQASTYTVTATDSGGCSVVTSQSIGINPVLNVSINVAETSGVTNDNIICQYDAGTTQATLAANVNGGIRPYSYNWSPQTSTVVILLTSPIVTTSYTVDVTDARGCTNSAMVALEVPDTPIIWTGPTNRNWYDNPNYWNFGRFPTVCDHVIIPSGKLVTLRSGFHGWANTLEVNGQFDAKLGSELDVITQQ